MKDTKISTIPVHADGINGKSVSKDTPVSCQPLYYAKITTTAAVALIAIFWMKVLKKKK